MKAGVRPHVEPWTVLYIYIYVYCIYIIMEVLNPGTCRYSKIMFSLNVRLRLSRKGSYYSTKLRNKLRVEFKSMGEKRLTVLVK